MIELNLRVQIFSCVKRKFGKSLIRFHRTRLNPSWRSSISIETSVMKELIRACSIAEKDLRRKRKININTRITTSNFSSLILFSCNMFWYIVKKSGEKAKKSWLCRLLMLAFLKVGKRFINKPVSDGKFALPSLAFKTGT